jgi:hypothetical protein
MYLRKAALSFTPIFDNDESDEALIAQKKQSSAEEVDPGKVRAIVGCEEKFLNAKAAACSRSALGDEFSVMPLRILRSFHLRLHTTCLWQAHLAVWLRDVAAVGDDHVVISGLPVVRISRGVEEKKAPFV